MKNEEEFMRFLRKVKSYKDKVNGISISIEEMDSNFVYLIHNISLSDEDIMDVYAKGLAYSGNDIIEAFNNLS